MMTELNAQTFEQAIKNAKPSVVELWAGWCMPCKIFAPVMEEISDEIDDKADFYKLNIDEYQTIAQRYNITGIPTLLVFKNGEEVDRSEGIRDKASVVAMIEQHAN